MNTFHDPFQNVNRIGVVLKEVKGDCSSRDTGKSFCSTLSNLYLCHRSGLVDISILIRAFVNLCFCGFLTYQRGYQLIHGNWESEIAVNTIKGRNNNGETLQYSGWKCN